MGFKRKLGCIDCFKSRKKFPILYITSFEVATCRRGFLGMGTAARLRRIARRTRTRTPRREKPGQGAYKVVQETKEGLERGEARGAE